MGCEEYGGSQQDELQKIALESPGSKENHAETSGSQ